MLGHHGIVDGATVTHDMPVRHDELPERSLDLVEVGVGDESIDAGVDAGRLAAMHIAARRSHLLEHDPEKWIPVFGKVLQQKARAGSRFEEKSSRSSDWRAPCPWP